MDVEKDEKLLQFLETLGQDADVDFARTMLEENAWNVEAAINMVVGGGAGAQQLPSPQNSLPPDYVDEEGYRAPMRTGYTDQLLGPTPEELVWEQAAMQSQFARHEAEGLGAEARRHRGHRSDDVQAAMQASRQEYQRLADQQEQGLMAQALQASYADYTVDEQRRMQQGFQDQSEEQRLIAQAIEASYRVQTNSDAAYREQLERVMAESKQQDRSTPSTRSGRTSPTTATSATSGRDLRSRQSGQSELVTRSPQSGSSLRPSRPSSGENPMLSPTNPMLSPTRHNAEVRSGTSASSSSGPRPSRLSRGNSGVSYTGSGLASEAPAVASGSRVSAMQPKAGRSIDDNSGRSVRAKTEAVPSRVVLSAVRNGSGGAVGSRQSKDPMVTHSSTSSTAGQAPLGNRSRASDHRPQAPGPLPSAPPPPAASGSRARMQTPPSALLRPGVEELSQEAKKDLRPGLRPLNASRVMTREQADAAKMDTGRRQIAEESHETQLREEEERRRLAREADERRQRIQRVEAEELASRQAEAERQRRQAAEAAEAERQRSIFAEQERQKRTAAAVAESSRLAEAEKQRKAQAELRAKAAAEQRSQAEAELKAKAAAEERRREEAEAARRAQEQAVANAAAEAERQKREAAEFEAENRRREAKEAEDLRKEREEAENRRREEEKAKNPEEKEKEKDEFVTALVALRKQHKEDPDALATCLKTMRTYINNLAGNPHEPKFQRINMENSAFQTRVAALEGSIAVLIACGYQKEGTSLIVGEEFLKTKGPRLFDAVAKIDVVVDQLKR